MAFLLLTAVCAPFAAVQPNALFGPEHFGSDRAATLSTQPSEAIARAAQCSGQHDDITVLTLHRMVSA
ncbi:MAG: hypothetical protein ACLPLZ_10520 [Terracidiphilus sp.]